MSYMTWDLSWHLIQRLGQSEARRVFFFFFFFPILWCSHMDNHPQEERAKVGFRSDRIVYSFVEFWYVFLATFKNPVSKYGDFHVFLLRMWGTKKHLKAILWQYYIKGVFTWMGNFGQFFWPGTKRERVQCIRQGVWISVFFFSISWWS